MKKSLLKTAVVAGMAISSFGVMAESSITSSSDINIDNTAGLSMKSGDHYFQIGGRLMFDSAIWDGIAYSGVDDEGGSGSEIRRARIYLKGKYKDWQYRFQTDFADGTSNKSTYIKYTGLNAFDIYIGKHAEPFGLENLTSSKYISSIERTATGNALFAGNRELGVSIASHGHNYGYQVGVFDVDSNATDTNLALTGRFTYAPINNHNHILHVGVSASSRQLDENSEYGVKERAGVHTSDIKPINTGTSFGDSLFTYNFEATYTLNQFNVVGEYLVADLSGVTATDERSWSSYYVQTGFFLTDDQRSYDVASGTSNGVKPNSESGAWEVFARMEDISYSDKGVGTDGEIITLGVNWFANKYTRISVNYVTADIDDVAVGSNVDGQALNIRAQFHW